MSGWNDTNLYVGEYFNNIWSYFQYAFILWTINNALTTKLYIRFNIKFN